MIGWLIGAVTLILVVLIVGRRRSTAFRHKAEQPKFQFLANLGVDAESVMQQQAEEVREEPNDQKPEGKI